MLLAKRGPKIPCKQRQHQLAKITSSAVSGEAWKRQQIKRKHVQRAGVVFRGTFLVMSQGDGEGKVLKWWLRAPSGFVVENRGEKPQSWEKRSCG